MLRPLMRLSSQGPDTRYLYQYQVTLRGLEAALVRVHAGSLLTRETAPGAPQGRWLDPRNPSDSRHTSR